MIGVSPYQRGEARTRWWLAGIRQHIAWLHGKALSTVWRCLRRFALVIYLLSQERPDPRLIWLSLYYPVYYLAASFYVDWRIRRAKAAH